MDDREYLENKLQELKLELRELNVQHRIEMRVFEEKKNILDREITDLEIQNTKINQTLATVKR